MKMVDIFKALGDETRIRILNILFQSELCVCEIEAILGITQSNASRHLIKLRQAGIIDYKKSSQWVFYFVSPEFSKDNKMLEKYLLELMSRDARLITDLEKLRMMKQGDISCQQIENS